jgi:hypothetical protein
MHTQLIKPGNSLAISPGLATGISTTGGTEGRDELTEEDPGRAAWTSVTALDHTGINKRPEPPAPVTVKTFSPFSVGSIGGPWRTPASGGVSGANHAGLA